MAALKFDPFAAVRETPDLRDSEGSFHPGELMGRQLIEAKKLIEEAMSIVKSGRDTAGHQQRVADIALNLMNSWASLFDTPGGDLIKESEVLKKREIQHILGSFMAGYNAALLLALTAEGDQEDNDAALEMLNAMIRKEISKKALNKKQEKLEEKRNIYSNFLDEQKDIHDTPRLATRLRKAFEINTVRGSEDEVRRWKKLRAASKPEGRDGGISKLT